MIFIDEPKRYLFGKLIALNNNNELNQRYTHVSSLRYTIHGCVNFV